MEIHLQKTADFLKVSVEGRLDNFTYEHLTERMRTVFEMGYTKLCLDISKTTYMNIATIRFVVSFAKQMKSTGGELAIMGTSEPARTNLSVFGSKYLKFLCLVISFVMSICSAKASTPDWIIHLYERLEANDEMAVQKLNIAFNGQEVRASHSALYPGLGVLAGVNKGSSRTLNASSSDISSATDAASPSVSASNPTSGTSVSVSPDASTVQASLTYVLFSQFAITENIRKAENGKQQAEFSLASTRMQKRAQLLQLLLEWRCLSRANEPLQRALATVSAVESHAKNKAGLLYSADDIANLNEKRTSIEYNNVRVNEGKALVEEALLDIVRDLKVEELSNLPPFKIAYDIPAKDQLARLYKEKSLSWKISQLQVDSARGATNVTAWQQPYIPVATAGLSKSYTRPFSSADTSDSWSAQVLLSFNIFDGYAQDARSQQARIALKFSEVKAQIEMDKRLLYVQHERMKALVAQAEHRSRESIVHKKRIARADTERKHTRGLATSLELAGADLELAKAEIEALESMKTYHTAALNVATELNDFENVRLERTAP